MSLGIRLSPRARADVQQAFDWYGSKRQGLGDEFIAALDEVLEQVADNPTAFQRFRRGVRRALIRRFPYSVYFRIEDEYVFVLAVFHSSRNPAKWKRRGQ